MRTCWFVLAALLQGCSPPPGELPVDPDTGTPPTDSGPQDVAAEADAAVDTEPLDTGRPCDTTKSPSEDPCVLQRDVGIFVSASTGSDDAPADGTRFRPFKTIGKALGVAQSAGKNVFACAEKFTEVVTLLDGVHLYGGVDCKGGGIALSGRSQIEAVGPALVAKKTSKPTRVQDFDVKGTAPVGAGTSAVAMMAVDAVVELTRVTLVAGDGNDGTSGTPGATGAAGLVATAGGDSSACGTKPVGGTGGGTGAQRGGDGGAPSCGAEPKPGSDAATVSGTAGKGGGAGRFNAACTSGNSGTNGSPGTHGTGGASFGAVVGDTYVATNQGTGGGDGTAGGGGGGGGAGYYDQSTTGTKYSGGAGGGGGGGGLAGKGATPGGGGGASIALLSIRSSVSLTSCSLETASGGKGGVGGDGGGGGLPGPGRLGGKATGLVADPLDADQPGCAGGPGGSGGAGGSGGGGGGGPSIGLLVVGTEPTRSTTTIKLGTPGAGGPGGKGAPIGASGTTGTSVDVFLVK